MASIQLILAIVVFVITTTSGENIHANSFGGKHSQMRAKKLLSKYNVGGNLVNSKSELSSGACYSWGYSHYKTFDGLEYTFQGQCSFTLLESKDESLEPLLVNVKTDVTKKKTSIEQIDVFVYNTLITLSKSMRPMTLVNGMQARLPVTRAFGDLVVKYEGNYAVLHTTLGLKIRWDGNLILIVEVPDIYRGKLSGLCGNYDNNVNNEMIYPDGTLVLNTNDFVIGWSSSPAECLVEEDFYDPCIGKTSDEIRSIIEFCSIALGDTGPFKNANKEFTNKIFNTCVSDTCLDWPNYSCENMAMLAQISLDAGINIEEWRSEDYCPMNCPENSKYSLCGSTCPDTCVDYILSQAGSLTAECQDIQCVEGCECEPGFYQSDWGQCVLNNNCGCWTDGYYFRAGDIFTKEAQGLEYLCMRSDKVSGIGEWWYHPIAEDAEDGS